ncbi:MAG TPA: transposase [Candidatus Competibacteraceae bacterium]|nr:transposase [Candidatus Competibacteraceae bacterium]
MLSAIFNSFIEASPLSVMMRGLAERLLNPEQLDPWFEQFAQEQYTRELLFSTVVSLMLEVVCGTRKSVNAAYQAMQAAIPVSIQAVYDKLRGMEPGVAAELVRYAARDGQAVIAALAGASPAVLPGYPVRILDGNHLAATEHRLKALRSYAGGALPGQALVVYDPDRDLALEVVPCENGHTQERALLAAVEAHLAAGQVWVMDRNFCVLHWLQRIAARPAYFVVREHEQTPFTPLAPIQEKGATETGWIGEQPIQVLDSNGQPAVWRRIRVLLQRPTRGGDDRVYLWTNLPATVTAVTVARLYLKRWRIETAVQHLAQDLNTEIKTLGYPRAALFGFCIGLVAYNSLAVLKAALRRAHGAENIDTALSGYYVADEVSGTYRGMMIAIPPAEWQVFRHLPVTDLAAVLINLAGKVCLARFRKHPRGPKKPRPPRQFDPKHPHQATVNLLVNCRK